MSDETMARRERAERRRREWSISSLDEVPPKPNWDDPEDFQARCREMEQLRRIACELAGIPYPEGPTPKSERRNWPLERIG